VTFIFEKADAVELHLVDANSGNGTVYGVAKVD